MAAWKAAKIGKEYEAQGGDYDNEAGSKNKPEKGPPTKKSEAQKKDESKVSTVCGESLLLVCARSGVLIFLYTATVMSDSSNTTLQESGTTTTTKGRGRPKGAATKKKEKTEPQKAARSSARQAGKKADDGEVGTATKGKKRKSAGNDGEEGAAKKSKKDK